MAQLSAGDLAGLALSPLTGTISALRRSRMFHPNGVLCAAHVEPLAVSARLTGVASALAGPALVRWSSAWWKHGERHDVLGCAIRFGASASSLSPTEDAQDLLLATIQRPWSMLGAPWTTAQHDFLSNVYFGVSPFRIDVGRQTRGSSGAGTDEIEWRLVPEQPSPAGASRRERLERALASGSATLRLELATYHGPWRRPRAADFWSVARVVLKHVRDDDPAALRFDPFRAGRGIVPVGFVHTMRRLTYAASQRLRPGGSS
jgi:hypothetical protein